MNKQPFRLGTGGAGVLGVGTGDWRLIRGDVIQWTSNHLGWELGTYTWRCDTMNKQPFRLGTGDWGLVHGDVILWTNNHWDWEQGAGVLGLGTGELYVEMLNFEQTITNNHLSWELGADVLGVGTGDWGHGDVIQWTNSHLGWELGRGWGFRGVDWGLETYTWRCDTMNKQPFRLGTGEGLGF